MLISESLGLRSRSRSRFYLLQAGSIGARSLSALRAIGFQDLRPERIHDFGHDLARPRFDRHHDGMFVGSGLFQGVELTLQQAWRHEMLVARGKAAADQFHIALQIYQLHVGAVADDNGAVAALERRTG